MITYLFPLLLTKVSFFLKFSLDFGRHILLLNGMYIFQCHHSIYNTSQIFNFLYWFGYLQYFACIVRIYLLLTTIYSFLLLLLYYLSSGFNLLTFIKSYVYYIPYIVILWSIITLITLITEPFSLVKILFIIVYYYASKKPEQQI